LGNTRLSPKSYAHLSNLTKLKYLNLSSTEVYDETLKILSYFLHNLELIYLVNCKHTTDDGIQHLRNLPKLKIIFTNDGLKPPEDYTTINGILSLKGGTRDFWIALIKEYH
jgi:hypothetical protein